MLHRVLSRATNGEVGGTILANIIRVCVWGLGISAIMSMCLGINPSVIWGALGIGGVALSLGLQSTISNLIGGLQISLSRDVSVGDWVVIGSGVPSKVIDINWRVTKLIDEFGNVSIVPNQVLNSTAVVVQPTPNAIYIDIALASDVDLAEISEKLVSIADDALVKADMRYEDKQPLVSFMGSTVDSIAVQLKLFTKRDFNRIEVNNVAIPPVIEYLESIGALAHCYSGPSEAALDKQQLE